MILAYANSTRLPDYLERCRLDDVGAMVPRTEHSGPIVRLRLRRHQSGCWSQGSSRGSGQVSSFFEGTTSQRAARVPRLNKSSSASTDSHVDSARTAKEKGTLTMPVNVPARAGDEIRTRDVQLGTTPVTWSAKRRKKPIKQASYVMIARN